MDRSLGECGVISPHGLLLVETPNIHFLKSAHIFHPFCYSKRSLAALLERHGFAPAAVAPDGPVKSIFSSGFFTLAARADSNGNARHTQDHSGSSALTGALIGLGQGLVSLGQSVSGEPSRRSPQWPSPTIE